MDKNMKPKISFGMVIKKPEMSEQDNEKYDVDTLKRAREALVNGDTKKALGLIDKCLASEEGEESGMEEMDDQEISLGK